MKEHTCCVTGHRKIEGMTDEDIRAKLQSAIEQAITDGYTHFISGFANGVDLVFAEIVAELKGRYLITLEAAIPHRGRLATKNKQFQQLLTQCDQVTVTSEVFHKGCYLERNRQMVDQSNRVIAVYDGRDGGGTAYTVRYADLNNDSTAVLRILER